MSILALEFRSSYCVAKTLFKYFKLSDNQPCVYIYRNCTFYFLSRRFKTNMGVNVEVKSHVENFTESAETERKISLPSKDVLEYMNSKSSLKSILSDLPSKILRRKMPRDSMYLVDEEVARDIASDILDNIGERRNTPIFEINPGIGALSKELLLGGVNCLHLCEHSKLFYRKMEMLLADFPTKTHLLQQDLLSLSKLSFLDKQVGGSRIEEVFRNVSKVNWNDYPPMIIVGAVPSLAFIRYLIYCHIHQTSILTYGRPELYVVMSPSHYFYLASGKNDGYLYYRSLTVLFQLIFQFNVLRKVPRKAFLPWETKRCLKKGAKLHKAQCIDPEFLYLVKIVPHRDFFERVVKVEELHQFWYFIFHHMVSRKNRVIPQLEKWIPGCGPRLITCDMTIFTEFGDLTPYQILSLFHEFTRWPEFSECPFLSSMESTLMLMEKSSDEVKESHVRIENEEEMREEYQESDS